MRSLGYNEFLANTVMQPPCPAIRSKKSLIQGKKLLKLKKKVIYSLKPHLSYLITFAPKILHLLFANVIVVPKYVKN